MPSLSELTQRFFDDASREPDVVKRGLLTESSRLALAVVSLIPRAQRRISDDGFEEAVRFIRNTELRTHDERGYPVMGDVVHMAKQLASLTEHANAKAAEQMLEQEIEQVTA